MASKKRKQLLRQARMQFRTYRNENPEEFENQPLPGAKKKIEWSTDSNEFNLQQMREERQNRKREKRSELRKAKTAVRESRLEQGPKIKIEYSYEPGELVRITEKACKRYNLDYYNLYPGATGIIVEQNDHKRYSGNEIGRFIQVMGPNGLQQWDVAWVAFVDEE